MAKASWKAEHMELALLAEIDRLEQRISQIKVQQDALKASLAAHRMRKLRVKGAIRKNSFSRLVAQRRILDALKQWGKPAPTFIIYKAVVRGHEREPMPNSTFRSLLFRMKEDGLIVSGPLRGTYMLPPPESD